MIYVVPPDALIQDCPVDEPPTSLDKYLLVQAWNNQTLNLAKCSTNLRELREWKKEVQKVEGDKGGTR